MYSAGVQNTIFGRNINQDSTENCEPTEVTFELHQHNSEINLDPKSLENNTPKDYVCSICPKTFETSLGLICHLNIHTNEPNKFKCSDCLENFTSYKMLTGHYLKSHTFENPDIETDEELERQVNVLESCVSKKCYKCPEYVNDKHTWIMPYSEHVIAYHSDDEYLLKNFTFCCTECNKPHKAMLHLQNHWKKYCFEKWKAKNNGNDLAEGYVCLTCGLKLSNELSLASHTRDLHLIDKNYVCDQCGKRFRNKTQLNVHVIQIHRREYKYDCKQCEKKFESKHKLKKHTEMVHLKLKRFFCKFCSKGFYGQSSLETHENIHTGAKPYKCKLCDKTFAASSTLTIHEGYHNGYKCQYCPEEFKNYVDLCAHRKTVHRKKENNATEEGKSQSKPTSICDICGKDFKSYCSLNIHKKYTHSNRNYVCEICGKSFKSEIALKSHAYSHDVMNRFGCSLCEKTFRQPTNFYQHRKLIHVDENVSS